VLNLSSSDDNSGTLCRRMCLASISPAATTTLAPSVGAHPWPQSLSTDDNSGPLCGCTPEASISPAATTLAHSVGAHPRPRPLQQRRQFCVSICSVLECSVVPSIFDVLGTLLQIFALCFKSSLWWALRPQSLQSCSSQSGGQCNSRATWVALWWLQ